MQVPAGGSITDVPGIKVGQVTDQKGCTGVTVLIAEEGAVAGVDVRGGAPGTREVALLEPGRLVSRVHAVVLAGGSAFGLAAAEGVVEYLAERDVGFDTGVVRVPIVPAAVLFDLGLGDARARPDRAMGYQACAGAQRGPVREGNVGAGTGATVGKVLGHRRAMKGGVGSVSMELAGGIRIGALAAVNAFGDVRDPDTGDVLAGALDPETGRPAGTMEVLARNPTGGGMENLAGNNTTLAVVATNAGLTREQAAKVASMAQNGLAVALSPAHTMLDGDVVFVLSTGGCRADASIVGALAATLVAGAIKNAVLAAAPLAGIRAYRDLVRG